MSSRVAAAMAAAAPKEMLTALELHVFCHVSFCRPALPAAKQPTANHFVCFAEQPTSH